jgi:SAM-dependent methyltransferase
MEFRATVKRIPVAGPAAVRVNAAIKNWRFRRFFARKNRVEKFTQIYEKNFWRGSESRSGKGSSLTNTANIRRELPPLLSRIGVRSLLDIPCGDFNWMKEVDLSGIDYLGGDIVESVISANNERYHAARRHFAVLDIVHSPLPRVDLILCRDCLVHLPTPEVQQALANITSSETAFVVLTHYPAIAVNQPLPDLHWRPLNLQLAPFHFPRPVRMIVENEQGKSAALWRVADLALAAQGGSPTPATPAAR